MGIGLVILTIVLIIKVVWCALFTSVADTQFSVGVLTFSLSLSLSLSLSPSLPRALGLPSLLVISYFFAQSPVQISESYKEFCQSM